MVRSSLTLLRRNASVFFGHAGGMATLLRQTLYWVFLGPFRERGWL